jgi:glycine cleavage system protein P-like pyridoxal-binding family
MQVVRHYTNLSRKNFSIDTQFYPLGSCTMKYNPRGAHKAAMLPGFFARHPLAPVSHSQGYIGLPVRLAGSAERSDRHEGRVADACGGSSG